MNRLELREQIMLCEGCELFKKGNGPVPFSGPTPAHLAIIGEAPGKTEDKEGQPFIGRSGQLLRDHLSQVGIGAEHVFFANTVSCWPDGNPTPEHVNACAGNFTDQLELAKPRWVLLLGAHALSTLRTDLKIGRAHAHVFYPPNRPRFLASVHPSYALRNRKGELMLHRALEILAEMIAAGDDWLLKASDDCIACGTDAETLVEHDGHLLFDEMGAPFCDTCWGRRPNAGMAIRRDFPGDGGGFVSGPAVEASLF